MTSLPSSSPEIMRTDTIGENRIKEAIDQGAEELERVLASYEDTKKLREDLTWSNEHGGLALYIINHASKESLKLLDIFLSAFKDHYDALYLALSHINQAGDTCLTHATQSENLLGHLKLICNMYKGKFLENKNLASLNDNERQEYCSIVYNASNKALRHKNKRGNNALSEAFGSNCIESIKTIIPLFFCRWKDIIEALIDHGIYGNALCHAVGKNCTKTVAYYQTLINDTKKFCKNDTELLHYGFYTAEALYQVTSVTSFLNYQSLEIQEKKRCKASLKWLHAQDIAIFFELNEIIPLLKEVYPQ